MRSVCERHFQNPILDIPDEPIILQPPLLMFGDFINSAIPKENRNYAEIPDLAKLMVVVKASGIESLFENLFFSKTSV